MIQPLFAFADLGFFLLRIFLGVLIFESGWKSIKQLKQSGHFTFISGLVPSFTALLGLIIILGGFVQIASLAVLVVLSASRNMREQVGFSERGLGLLLISLLTLVFAGGGMLGVDRLFGFVIY